MTSNKGKCCRCAFTTAPTAIHLSNSCCSRKGKPRLYLRTGISRQAHAATRKYLSLCTYCSLLEVHDSRMFADLAVECGDISVQNGKIVWWFLAHMRLPIAWELHCMFFSGRCVKLETNQKKLRCQRLCPTDLPALATQASPR